MCLGIGIGDASNNESYICNLNWQSLNQELPTPLSGPMCGQYDNNMFVIGGEGSLSSFDNDILFFNNYSHHLTNDGTNLWQNLGSWATDSQYGSVSRIYQKCFTVVDKIMYIINPYPSQLMLLYNMSSMSQIDGSTYSYTTLLNGYYGPCIVNNGTHVFTVGGFSVDAYGSNVLQIYSIEHDSWTNGDTLNTARGLVTCQYSNYSNKIYAFGGRTTPSVTLSSIEAYDLELDKWTTLSDSMPGTREGASSFIFDNYIYIIGGASHNGGYLSSGIVFDVESETMVSINVSISLPAARESSCAVQDANNNAYLIGGVDGGRKSTIYYAHCDYSQPTQVPSSIPTKIPTYLPTAIPTDVPTNVPSGMPTSTPSDIPTHLPTTIPSDVPSDTPTDIPSGMPSRVPTVVPSNMPTDIPTTHSTQTTEADSNLTSTIPNTTRNDIHVDEEASDGLFDSSVRLDVLHDVYIIILSIVGLVMFVLVIGIIIVKYKRNNVFKWVNIAFFVFYTFDFISHCFFTIQLVLLTPSLFALKFCFLIISIIFIVVPVAVNCYTLHIHRKLWLENQRINETVGQWLRDYKKWLYLITVLSGSSFNAVKLCNSNLFQFDLFNMNLSKRDQQIFNNERLFVVVLLQVMCK